MNDTANTLIAEPDAFALALEDAVSQSRRVVRLYGEQLEPVFFNAPGFVETLRRFCSEHPQASVKILSPSDVSAADIQPALFELTRRLSSRIEIRVAADAEKELQGQFLVGDRSVVLHRPDVNAQHAYFNADYASRAVPLLERFDHVWGYAVPHPDCKSVML